LVSAYSVFSTPGRRVVPRGWQRIEQPDGSPLGVNPTRSHAVSSKASAWIVRDLLLNAVREGTARSAQIENIDVAAKTGSSSGLRDAWLAGSSGHLVVVVWVGRDDSGPLGSTASRTAAPIWKAFVEHATRLEATEPISQPRGVVAASIDRRTGLRVDPSRSSARQEWFRRGSEPPKQRFWRRSQSQTPIR
ncbi:MAG: penicillin-binding transpeptidase domain-containing protein, partial [Acidobacteriota bacterium]|nr:penicillin-binding transpeptidase domain-containing protein [Acidobacteriota bacterium]